MIGQKNRFHGRGSIRKLYSNGKSVRNGSLALKFNTNPHRTSYRLAIVVSRKVSKSAVIRNRIRRRLYEDVRILSRNLIGPYDLVITVYDEQIARMPATELLSEVTTLCKKAKIVTVTPTARAIVESKEI